MMESSNEERQLNARDDNLHQLPDETTRENRVSTKRERDVSMKQEETHPKQTTSLVKVSRHLL